MKQKILNLLDSLEITYQNYEHKPAFSCNDAKGIDIPGKRVKSLFIRNKKATKYYMVILEDDIQFDSRLFRQIMGENKISFASEERMINKIGVKPGHVSPFALINNNDRDVEVIFNSSLSQSEIGFHPGQNDNTTVLNISGVEVFLTHLGITFKYLAL